LSEYYVVKKIQTGFIAQLTMALIVFNRNMLGIPALNQEPKSL